MRAKNKQAFQTLDLAYMAIGAVLIAVCSWISIPANVPFTLQTFAVFFVLSILGGRRGTISVLLYILLGAVGIPVFAGFSSGIGVLLGSTGGYIIGFILMGLAYRLIVRLPGKRLWVEIAAMLIGLILCYAMGTAWFMVVFSRQNGAVSLATVLAWCVIPFIIPDLIKLALAILLSKRLSPVLKIRPSSF
ncbi:MAG: biotin transporter BioY [Clostridia bacterium]|nr:biotin transporter BioY [Clostridia bacterium]